MRAGTPAFPGSVTKDLPYTEAKSRTRYGAVVRYTCALPRGWGIAMAMQRAPLSRQFEAVR